MPNDTPFILDLFVTNTIKINKVETLKQSGKLQKLHEMMKKFWIAVSEERSFMTPEKATSQLYVITPWGIVTKFYKLN